MNPGGSIKDRAAKGMIRRAEAEGWLRPGGTIVEGTAGNTGIGLGLLGRERGYRVVVTMPDNQAREKYELLEAMGVEIRRVPAGARSPTRGTSTTRRALLAEQRGLVLGQPVREHGERRLPRRDHRPGDPGAVRGPHRRAGLGRGHRRDDLRREPLPQVEAPARAGGARRSAGLGALLLRARGEGREHRQLDHRGHRDHAPHRELPARAGGRGDARHRSGHDRHAVPPGTRGRAGGRHLGGPQRAGRLRGGAARTGARGCASSPSCAITAAATPRRCSTRAFLDSKQLRPRPLCSER